MTTHTYPGQALVILLVFAAITITITAAAATVTIINSTASSWVEQGEMAYNVAESGVENALIRLLRDPAYTGETLTVGAGTATIAVSGTGPYTLISTGTVGDFSRKIQAVAQFTTGVMTVTSWVETY